MPRQVGALAFVVLDKPTALLSLTGPPDLSRPGSTHGGSTYIIWLGEAQAPTDGSSPGSRTHEFEIDRRA